MEITSPAVADAGWPTLWDAFRRSLTTNRGRPALSFGDETWLYSDVAAAVANAACRLAGADVRPGGRVVLLTEPGLAFPVYDLAIMALGAVKVPLNTQLTADDVAGIVARVEPAVVVISPSLEPLIHGIGSGPQLLDDAVEIDGSLPLPPVGAASPRDPAVVYFTGGTTGKPKGIVHSQVGVVANLLAHLLEGGIGRDERLVLATPLSHAAGIFLLSSLLRGGYARIQPRFDPDRIIDVIDADRITWMWAVPTMIYRLLDAAERRDWAPTTLRTLQYGGAPISVARLREALGRFGPVLQQLYGQAECPNYGTLLRKEDHARALDEPPLLQSCGRASIMCNVTIRDDDGHEVPPGTTGEVCLRSPYVMDSYWDDPDGFAERFFGPWLRTGDIGYQDEEGNVFLVDRRNDMIISGGMNVYSLEVEEALRRFPGVVAAAVIGVPHDDWGEAVHAVVVPSDGLDRDALADHARTSLAAYKRPKSYEFVDALPLTSYGKIDKKALRSRIGTAMSGR